MMCPDCGYDNIDGVDICEACEQPLVEFDPSGTELEQSISRHCIEALCQKSPIGVSPSTTLRDAVGEMNKHNIGCLLVLDDEELLGVFTERDVLNQAAKNFDTLDHPVAEFMTPSPVTVTKQDSIAYALHAMDLGGYRHMPIVDEAGHPVGVISVRDILRFLCIRFAELRKKDL